MTVGSDCPTNKEQFATRAAAQSTCASRRAQGDTTLSVYRCIQCDCYHLGHKRRADKRRALNRGR